MSKLILTGSVIILLLLMVSGIGSAQEQEELKYGVGFQITPPAFGLSGMADLNEKTTVQVVMWGFMGKNEYIYEIEENEYEISLAVKGLRRFKRADFWNSYGYGIVNINSAQKIEYRGSGPEIIKHSNLGLGAGFGLEWDVRSWYSKIPPLFLNLEIGMMARANLDNNNLRMNSFKTIIMGSGLHYRF